MLTTRFLAAVTVFAAGAAAQLTLVTPTGYDVIEGTSNNAFPWNRGVSSMHYQQIIDSTQFPTGPILVQGMRFRADATTATWAGGTWPNVQIDVASATVDYLSRSLTFASNMAGDRITAYSGPVTVQPGTGNGAGVPGPWHIQITFTTPFLYDPSLGNDFVFDVQLDGTGWAGGAVQCDAQDVTSLSTRLWDASSATSPTATGSSGDYGLVCEFTYVPAVGFAYSTTYGTGCYDSPRMVMETFPVSTPVIDLVNTNWLFVFLPNAAGGSYFISPGGAPFDATGPLSGTNILSGTYTSTASASWDDASLVYTLPVSTFPGGFDFPGGNCTEITINSNGKVFLGNTTDPSFVTNGAVHGDPSGFNNLLPQIAPCLNDLDPTVGGGIYVEDPSPNGGVRITWLGVPNWQDVSGPTAALNDIQCELLPGGQMNWAYGANLGCSGSNTNNAIVGFSAGAGNPVTQPIDWSAINGLVTGDGTSALALSASARPIIGTTPNLLVDNIPSGSPIAALLLGLTKFDPGISLAGIGMPGCSQYSSSEATVLLIGPGTSAASPFAIPNLPGLAGVTIKAQAVSLNTSIQNALNANASNGLQMIIDIN